MKKIITSLFLLTFYYVGFAQAPRLVCVEEFTQASCPPCAAQNPAFNTLLQANTTKCVSLKYQTSWPGYDPMNLQNPTDVQTRVTYYGITGVPNGSLDGVNIPNTCSAYVGAPACLDQPKIDAAYGILSPIVMTITHTISPDLDSIYIHISITNATASALTAANWKLQVAITEEQINFSTEPGTNGETEFYNVMRKMLPNADGTSMTSINSGASVNFDFNVTLPTYIYNYGQIGVVAFVQDNSTKFIQQAGISLPQSIPANNNFSDAGVVNQTNSPVGGLCDVNFIPTVQISNNFSTGITSATVGYTLNGGTPVTQPWTGNLSQGQTAIVTFPSAIAAAGNNSVIGSITNINGGTAADFNTMNNTTSAVTFATIPSTPFDTKIVEGFESDAVGGQPLHTILAESVATNPGVWVVDKTVNSSVTWNLGAFENSNKSYRWRFFTIGSGTYSLIFEKINLTGKTNVGLVFSYADALYSGTENDELKVAASTDCGTTWTTIWDQTGSALATVPATTSAYYPHSADWKSIYTSLSQFNNTADVMIKFEATSGNGNNLYVDDINLNSSVGVNEVENILDLGIYPNPATDNATVKFGLNETSNLKLVVTNLLGQIVMEKELGNYAPGQFETSINLNQLPATVYKVSLYSGNNVQTQKLSVVR